MQHTLLPRTSVLGALVVIVSLISVGFPAQATTIASDTPSLTIEKIVSATNDARIEAGLEPLATSSLLINSAQTKATDMHHNGYFAHTGKDGVRFWNFITAAGYRFAHAGENLALGYTSDEAVLEAWLNSPSHRANILSPKFTEIGIGLIYGEYQGHEQWFVVQHLGSTTY